MIKFFEFAFGSILASAVSLSIFAALLAVACYVWTTLLDFLVKWREASQPFINCPMLDGMDDPDFDGPVNPDDAPYCCPDCEAKKRKAPNGWDTKPSQGAN